MRCPTAGCRCWSRSRPTWPTRTCSPWPTWPLAIGLDGIIATNTTISRDGLARRRRQVERAGAGGLSGGPLTARSLEVLRLLRDRVGDDLTLIGVGGITTAADAQARLDAGADLLQGYTAFIYEGPGWPRRPGMKGIS